MGTQLPIGGSRVHDQEEGGSSQDGKLAKHAEKVHCCVCRYEVDGVGTYMRGYVNASKRVRHRTNAR